MTPALTRQTWSVDHKHQMLLNNSRVYNLAGCSPQLRTTQLEGIYLVELSRHEVQNKVTGLPQFPAQEVDLQVNNVVALDYTAYQLTQQIKTASKPPALVY